MLKAIVFDFDGVIADSEPTHYAAINDALGTIGVQCSFENYNRHLIGFDDRECFAFAVTHWAEPVHRANREETVLRLRQFKQERFVQRLADDGMAAVPGALELIGTLTGKLPIAIASGATREDIEQVIARFGCRDAFAAIITADDVARSKPDPTTYRVAVQRLAAIHPDLNIKPGDCLAIEDTPAGLRSARDAGLRTLALTTTHPIEQLHDAEHVVRDLSHVTLAQLRAWYD